MTNNLWQSTKKVLVKIGQFQSSLLMGLVYYLIIGPVAVIFQLLHRNKPANKSYWIKRPPIDDMGLYLKRQF